MYLPLFDGKPDLVAMIGGVLLLTAAVIIVYVRRRARAARRARAREGHR